MAFTVEDGSGVAGANSYCSVIDAGTYHSDRGDTGWTGTDEVKQAALVRATEYLEARCAWSTGTKGTEAQGLSWPRIGAYDRHGWSIDDDVVPQVVQDATAYLALQALSETLGAPLGRLKSSVKAGSVVVAWAPSAPDAKRYPLVDGMLAGLVSGGALAEVFLT